MLGPDADKLNYVFVTPRKYGAFVCQAVADRVPLCSYDSEKRPRTRLAHRAATEGPVVMTDPNPRIIAKPADLLPA
jgi:hypothetical protein